MDVTSPIYVFIDTNVIMKTGYNFHGGALYNLKKYCDSGIIALITNEIVVEEVKKNIYEQVKAAASQIKNCISEKYCISELRHSEKHRALFEDFRKQGWDQYIISQWEGYLLSTNCEIIKNDGIKLTSILSDYFNERPPFESRKDKKYEFPDAIIIKSLVQYAKINGSTFIVASEDKGWSAAFKGIANIHVVKMIKEALNFVSKETNPETTEQILFCIAEQHDKIIEYINEWLLDSNYELSVEYDDIEDFEVNSIKIAMDSLDYVEDDMASVTVIAEVKLTIEYSFFDYENSIFDREDHRYIYSHVGNIKEVHEGRINIEVMLQRYETQKYCIKQIQSNDKLILDEATCSESLRLDTPFEEEPDEDWFAEKQYDICVNCGDQIGFDNDSGNRLCGKCKLNR